MGFDAVAEDINYASGFDLVEDAFTEPITELVTIKSGEAIKGLGLGVAQEGEELGSVETVGAIIVARLAFEVACLVEQTGLNQGF